MLVLVDVTTSLGRDLRGSRFAAVEQVGLIAKSLDLRRRKDMN